MNRRGEYGNAYREIHGGGFRDYFFAGAGNIRFFDIGYLQMLSFEEGADAFNPLAIGGLLNTLRVQLKA